MNKSRLLLLLVFLLLLALYYAWQESPRQQRVAESKPAVKRSAAAGAQSPASSGAQLDFSGGEKLPFNKPQRDLFRPLYQAPKPEGKPVVAPPPPPPPPVPQFTPPPVISRPVVQPPSGPKPIPPLKVLGYLQKDGRYTAFLASPQGDVYVVKQGDRFADELLVRELTQGKLVVSRNAADPGVTIPLGDAKPQRMPVVAVPPSRPIVPIMQNFDTKVVNPGAATEETGANPTDP